MDLEKASTFAEADNDIKASLALINNYQNKQNYNHILLDEEKKSILQNLLDKAKSGFNNSVTIYDKNEELVGFVDKQEGRYKLGFVSYDKGEQVLLSRYEQDRDYHKSDFNTTNHIKKVHVAYYTQPELHEKIIITYHYLQSGIYLTSHNSAFDDFDNNKTIYHIEMSKSFSSKYFTALTKSTDVKISLSNKPKTIKDAPLLFAKEKLQDEDIYEDANNYSSSFLLHGNPDNIFITLSLDKKALYDSLEKNREQLFIFILFIALLILAFFYLLIRFGISKPLGQIMEQISKIKQGDYVTSEAVKTGDELEAISRNINRLASTVESRESSLLKSKKRLKHLSQHDDLTGLPNRRSFAMELKYAFARAKRNQMQLAVLFLDLDEFKQVNDTLGHRVGDRLLQAVAARLTTVLRESDVLARVGGDEFNILIDGFENIVQVQTFAQKLIDAFKEPFIDEYNEIASSTSIGIALYPDDAQDAEVLIKNADIAMYKAKEMGKNNYSFYSSKLSESLHHHTEIAQALKSAIKNQNEFVLHYQPKISIKTQKVVGVEALIRWNNPKLGFVSPDEFIKIAEQTHAIIDIGAWVLRQACEDFMTLKKSGYSVGLMSINVSGAQLEFADMLGNVKETMKNSGISAQELELEITESYIATNETKAIETLRKFKDMGISLAIDDFGTGYSSMSYLHELPITRLKIDKAFVDGLPESKRSVSIANAIISLAEAFELKITVEGVEKQSQLDFFKEKYCDDIQGYFYSKPLTFEDLKNFMDR